MRNATIWLMTFWLSGVHTKLDAATSCARAAVVRIGAAQAAPFATVLRLGTPN